MEYSVRHKKEEREGFGPYRYDILFEKRIVATYSHDFRGDDHWIDFENGETIQWPVGKMTDFLKGGGRQPLRLSEDAVAFLKENLEQ
jgi:hypothetical protein